MKMLVKDSLSIASIFVLFCLSFYQRQPHISNQTDAYDVANLQTLTTLDVWQQSSAAKFSFLPVQSYQNIGDKNIHYYQRFNDQKGNNYYVSYPPLSYLLPHFIHILGFDLNRKLLVWLNILLHLISTIFLYYLLKCFVNDVKFSINIISSLAYFILIPVMTYSFSRMYFVETLSLCLFIVCLFFLFKLLLINPKSNLYLLGFAFSFILLSYCEWISFFLLISLFFYIKYSKSIDKKSGFKITLVATLCFIIPMIIFSIQLLSLNSYSEGIHSLFIRLLERSGWFGQKYSSNGVSIYHLNSIFEFIKLFTQSIGIIGILMIIIGFINQLIHRNKKIDFKNQKLFFIMLILLPIITHTIVFFNANALHYHLQIKWILVICIFWGLVSQSNHINKKVYYAIHLLFILTLISIQFLIPRFSSKNADYLNQIAFEIKNQTDKKFPLFANIVSEPEFPFNLAYISYLSKRNIAFSSDTISAKNEAKSLNYSSFYFIQGEQNKNYFSIKKLNINQYSEHQLP